MFHNWTAADELQLKALTTKRELAQREARDALRKIVSPAIELSLPRIPAGSIPGWPGTISIAAAVAQALLDAGVAAPSTSAVRLAGFPEAGFEGGEALDAP